METIVVKEGEDIIQTIQLKNESYTIGSDENCDVVLDNLLVSPQHSQVVKIDNDWFYRDLKSEQGSFLDDMRIQEHKLKSGDEIQVANFILIFETGFIADDETETKLVYDDNSEKSPSDEFPKLVTKDKDGTPIEYVLNKFPLTVGRSIQADIVIEDITISRLHTKFYKENGKFYIKDLDSRNGTFLNKEQINTTEIKHGDTITFGTYSVKFIL